MNQFKRIERLYYNSYKNRRDMLSSMNKLLIEDSIQQGVQLQNPFKVSWNITNKCNLNCVYCSNSIYTTKNELSYEKKIEVIDKLKDNSINEIRLLGGEPTLVEKFDLIVDYILSNGIYLFFSSNGTGINEKLLAVLKKYSPHLYKINISCDSVIRKNNDYYRGEGSHRIAMEAIKILSKISNINLTVNSVISDVTKHDILETYNFLSKLNVKNYMFTLILPQGNATTDMIPEIDDEMIEQAEFVQKSIQDNRKKTLFSPSFGYLENIDEKVNENQLSDKELNMIFKKKCDAAVTRLHIESNGDVYPCDFLKYPDFFLGNILEDEFYDIWRNEITKNIWKMTRKDKKNCSACKNTQCNTGCMALAYKKYGSIYMNDPNCRRIENV